jgi:hypothetical protein
MLALGAVGLTKAAHSQATAPSDDRPFVLPGDFPTAKRIDVDVKGARLEEAMRPLRALLPPDAMLDVGDPSGLVTLQQRDMPFWDAMHAVLTQAYPGRPMRFTLGAEHERRQFGGRWSIAGPFLVMATRVYHQADYSRPENDVERCYIDLSVLADPGVQLAGASEVVTPVRALDEEGNSLTNADPPPARTGYSDRFGAGPARVELALRPPLAPEPGRKLGQRIAVVDGEIPAQIVQRMETLEFTHPETREQLIGGVTVKVRVEETEYFLNVFVDFLAGDISQEEWTAWTGRLTGTVFTATNGAGAPMKFDSWSSPNLNVPRRAHLQRQFGRTGQAGPFKATVQVPAAAIEVRIPYRFRDLPLP